MKSFVLLLVAASLVFLSLASSGSARPETTNPGGYLTVRVTVTDKGVTMSATHARRGTTAIFLVANRTTNARVVALGDATLVRVRGTGFAVELAQNGRKRMLVYLTYRGLLPVSVGTGGKGKVQGLFRVT